MLDLEVLLAPISEGAPAGPDLRDASDDVTLAEIAELRREIDPAVDPEGARAANWTAARSECEDALAHKSKDLQIAGWLAEAFARTEGFAGLAAGFDLIRELLERFWDDVHPRGEVDGEGVASYAVRAGSLNWISAARGMLPSVRAIGILSGENSDRAEWLSWESYLEAQRVDDAASSNKARHEEMVAAGAVTMKRWRQMGKATPVARLVEAHAALLEAQAAQRRLAECCEQRFPSDDQPSLLELSNLLGDIADWLGPKIPKTDAVAASEDGEPADELGEAIAPGAYSAPAAYTAAGSSGPIGTRDAAFARLREVAEYFRGAEPHSPISFLVDRAVRWGNLTFPQLMQEIVKTDESLTPIWDVLGIVPPSRDGGSPAGEASGDSSSSDGSSTSDDSSSSDGSDSGWGASTDE